jgi:hypothetical protein
VSRLADVRDALDQARDRGESFLDAWEIATPAIPLDSLDRVALDETRTAWSRSYSGTPATRRERAAAMVAGMFVEREDDAPEPMPGRRSRRVALRVDAGCIADRAR